jgi:D-glycero-D-manno-heptose 1,7-bisphosphate phosphatase
MNNAIFLDRDGVIIKDKLYVHKYKDIVWLKGVFEGIKYAKENNYLIIVVTNQSGIGRKIFKTFDMKELHKKMNKKIFAKTGFTIDKFYYCPFHPIYGVGNYKKKSFDRKPNPGMLIKAIKKYKINKKKSFMIGDQVTDKLAAKRADISFFYRSNKSLRSQFKEIINKN